MPSQGLDINIDMIEESIFAKSKNSRNAYVKHSTSVLNDFFKAGKSTSSHENFNEFASEFQAEIQAMMSSSANSTINVQSVQLLPEAFSTPAKTVASSSSSGKTFDSPSTSDPTNVEIVGMSANPGVIGPGPVKATTSSSLAKDVSCVELLRRDEECTTRNARTVELVATSNPFACSICNSLYSRISNPPQHSCSRFLHICKPCNYKAYNVETLRYHGLTREHLLNARIIPWQNRPSHDVVPELCFICNEATGSAFEEHLTTGLHQKKVRLLECYLEWCENKKYCPVTCEISVVLRFFNETSLDGNVFALQHLLVLVSLLHEKVGGKPICRIPEVIGAMRERFTNGSFARGAAGPEKAVPPDEIRPEEDLEDSEMCLSAKEEKHEIYTELTRSEGRSVTFCSPCDADFRHATNLLYHVYHKHGGDDLERFLVSFPDRKSSCRLCDAELDSDIAHALHADRHPAFGGTIACDICERNYPSAYDYHSSDFCGGIPVRAKKYVDQLCAKNGIAEVSAVAVKTVGPVPPPRLRSCSNSRASSYDGLYLCKTCNNMLVRPSLLQMEHGDHFIVRVSDIVEQASVSVRDILYDAKHGSAVLGKTSAFFRRYPKRYKTNLNFRIFCRFWDCGYRTTNRLKLFRHVKENHL